MTDESHLFDVVLPDGPYPGLRPFDTDEWPVFFGRERMSDEVVTRLVRQQFLVVHGDSGCGKSSLIRAGVLPRLEQENARGGLTWRTTVTQPRDAPLQLLAEALAALDDHAGNEARITDIRRVLNFGAAAPKALAQMLRRGPTDHLCILIDQFEELFAFARRHGPADARLFVQILVALLEQPEQGLYVVVTMRSEFLGACAHFPGLAEAVNRAQYLLPRMEHADLTRAIREPAALYGGQIAPDLAERLIVDSGGSQDQLPLIQHGLMLLSRRKRQAAGAAWRVDISDYTSIGNLTEALSRHADDVLASAEEEPFLLAERMFRSLTEINADGQAVRHPQTVAQLAAVSGQPAKDVIALVDAFRAEGASFLTPFGSEPLAPSTLVDISHEALIRCWSRIASSKSGWLVREFQDGLIWRSLLVQTESFERNASHLLSLSTAEEQEQWLARHNAVWAERYGGGWDRVQLLVQASLRTGRAARQEEQTRARRQLRYLTAFGAFLVLVAVTLLWLNTRTNDALARANDASAASLWNRFDFASADRLQDDELNALWEVRSSDEAVRSAFFDQLSRLHDRVVRLGKRPQPVLRALFLRWAQDKSDVVRDAVLREVSSAPDPASLIALAPAVQATAPSMTPVQAQQLFRQYLQTIRDAKTSLTPVPLSGAMQALAASMAPADEGSALTAVLDALDTQPIVDYFFVLGAAAHATADRLPADQANRALATVQAAISATGDANYITALTPAAQALARHISPDQIGVRLPQIVDAFEAAQSQMELSALTAIAQELSARTTALQADTVLRTIVAKGQSTADEYQRAALTAVDATLAEHATPANVPSIAAPLVSSIRDSKDARRATPLILLAQPMLPHLSADDRRMVLGPTVRSLASATSPLDINALASIVARHADVLSPDDNRQVVPALLVAARHASDDFSTDAFAAAAATMRLTPIEAQAQTTKVLARIQETKRPGELSALGSILSALAKGLSPADSVHLLPTLWPRIIATTDAGQLRALALAIPALSGQLAADTIRTSLPDCLRALAGTRDPDQVGALALAARTLADLLPDAERASALAPAQSLVDTETDPDRLARLSIVIPPLASGMTAERADALFPRLIVAMENTLYADQLLTLQAAATPVAAKLSAGKIEPFVMQVAKALAVATDMDRIDALTAAAQALGTRPDAAQGDLLRTLVAWSATPDQAAAATRAFLTRPASSGAQRTRELVELLKYPTTTGDATSLILEALQASSKDAPGKDAGLGANLDWIARTYPDIDLTTAPACPAPVLASLTCPTPQH
jgi:energy-coupling factor transporter ATP-binding protein EcfA2